MTVRLNLLAQEGSTYALEHSFFIIQPDGREYTIRPNAPLVWSLYDEDQNIINGRDMVPLTPAEVVYIVMAYEDLALSVDYSEIRRVVISGTYDGILGSNLPFHEEVIFQIGPIVNVRT